MSSLGGMLAHGRGSLGMVFREVVFELSLRFAHIVFSTVTALDVVYGPWFVLFCDLVLGVHQVLSDTIVGL